MRTQEGFIEEVASIKLKNCMLLDCLETAEDRNKKMKKEMKLLKKRLKRYELDKDELSKECAMKKKILFEA